MLGLLKKVFGSHGERQLKRFYPLIERINELEPQMQKKTAHELGQLTLRFQEQYQTGKAQTPQLRGPDDTVIIPAAVRQE